MKYKILTIVSIIIILIASIGFLQLIDQPESNTTTAIEFEWDISRTWQSVYNLVLISGGQIKLSDIQYEFLNEANQPIIFYDQSGQLVRMNGTVDEIQHNYSKRGDSYHALQKGWGNSSYEGFYSDYPDGLDNRSLYYYYQDSDSDGKFDGVKQINNENNYIVEGFFIRSISCNGPIGEGSKLILTDIRNGKTISTITFPSPKEHLSWSVDLIDNNYRILVEDITPTSIDNITFTMRNLAYGQSYKIPTIPEGDVRKLEGNLSTIVWNSSNYYLALNCSWQDSTIDNIFYADYPNGFDNRTLHIVYRDTDGDSRINKGDIFWLRSDVNGGICTGLFQLSLLEHNITLINSIRLEREDFSINWTSSVKNGTYFITIESIATTDNSYIAFVILDSQNQFIYDTNDSNEKLSDDFQSIRFLPFEYEAAKNDSKSNVYGQYFYKYGRKILTQYIVWEDVDADDYVSKSDRIIIRAIDQGGYADQHYIIRFVNILKDEIYCTIILP